MNAQDRSWCTVSEAAQILGVSVSTVKRRIKQGILKAKREGNRYLISRSSLERLSAQVSGSERSVSDQDELTPIKIEIERLREQNQALQEQNRILQKRIGELEADKAYLQERIIILEELVKSLTPKALPKPSLWMRIKAAFKQRKE